MPASQFKPQSDRIKKKNKRAKRVIRFRGSAHKAAGLYLPYGKTSGRKSAKAAAFIGLKKFHSLASGRERDRPKFDINFFSPFFFPPFPPPFFGNGKGRGREGRGEDGEGELDGIFYELLIPFPREPLAVYRLHFRSLKSSRAPVQVPPSFFSDPLHPLPLLVLPVFAGRGSGPPPCAPHPRRDFHY